MNEKLKQKLPYIYTSAGFIAGLIMLAIIFDSFLLPWIIHSREAVVVPDVYGKTYDEAQLILSRKNLTYFNAGEQYNAKLPVGIVVNQTPKAGMTVKEGRRIYLILSKGQESQGMPNLVGMSFKGIRIYLQNLGLNLGNVGYEYNDKFGSDTIISQKIPFKQPVNYGSTVDITVSKGLSVQVQVPKLIGSTIDEARAKLNECGLIIGTIIYEKSETYLQNTIIRQTPETGELADKKSAVNIVLSK
jgi:eukaryotic-like serine/threonine-protein kinase